LTHGHISLSFKANRQSQEPCGSWALGVVWSWHHSDGAHLSWTLCGSYRKVVICVGQIVTGLDTGQKKG
jgi:hypothetical protein